MSLRSDAAPESVQAACDRLLQLLEQSLEFEGRGAAANEDADRVRLPLSQYALSLVRMRLRPALEHGWATTDPVHVAMFGGTNSGKSTVLNILIGRAAAGMSPQARFSQHPEAFRAPALGNRFLDSFPSRFRGYLRHFDRHPPRQADDDLQRHGYRPALALIDPGRLPGQAFAPPVTRGAVLWDIPDFSTEEAQRYLSAVLDTVALADLVVMTVTRENYADHRGALLRSMIVESGVPLIVVANKLEPGSGLLSDIQRKLGEGNAGSRLNPHRIYPLPDLPSDDEVACLEQLMGALESDELRRGVTTEVALGIELKRRALKGTLAFLDRRLDDALAPLWAEQAQARRWHEIVNRHAQTDFYERYRRQYLDAEKYVDFNQTLVKLMDLLEIPGVGAAIAGVSKGIKAVSRFVVGSVARGIRRLVTRGDEPPRKGPELEVVAGAFEQWIDALKAEAQGLAGRERDPHWGEIEQQLSSPEFLHHYGDALGAAYHGYRRRMDEITTERARALYELIRKRPALLNTLRGVKVTLDVGTTALIVSSGGLNWTDAVIGPLVAPVQRLILEFGLDQYMSAQKSQLKQDQLAALRELIEAHMMGPVRALYRTAVGEQTLADARRDLQAIRRALLPSRDDVA
jgi:hypothetical protein